MSPAAELSRQVMGPSNSRATRGALLLISVLLLLLFVVASVTLVQIALRQNTPAIQPTLFYF